MIDICALFRFGAANAGSCPQASGGFLRTFVFYVRKITNDKGFCPGRTKVLVSPGRMITGITFCRKQTDKKTAGGTILLLPWSDRSRLCSEYIDFAGLLFFPGLFCLLLLAAVSCPWLSGAYVRIFILEIWLLVI